jgi:hypothetical protein
MPIERRDRWSAKCQRALGSGAQVLFPGESCIMIASGSLAELGSPPSHHASNRWACGVLSELRSLECLIHKFAVQWQFYSA